MNDLERMRLMKEANELVMKIETSLRSIVESIKAKKLKKAAFG